MGVVAYPQSSWFLLVKGASVLSDKITGITQICTFVIDSWVMYVITLAPLNFYDVLATIHGDYSTIPR